MKSLIFNLFFFAVIALFTVSCESEAEYVKNTEGDDKQYFSKEELLQKKMILAGNFGKELVYYDDSIIVAYAEACEKQDVASEYYITPEKKARYLASYYEKELRYKEDFSKIPSLQVLEAIQQAIDIQTINTMGRKQGLLIGNYDKIDGACNIPGKPFLKKIFDEKASKEKFPAGREYRLSNPISLLTQSGEKVSVYKRLLKSYFIEELFKECVTISHVKAIYDVSCGQREKAELIKSNPSKQRLLLNSLYDRELSKVAEFENLSNVDVSGLINDAVGEYMMYEGGVAGGLSSGKRGANENFCHGYEFINIVQKEKPLC